MRRFVAVGPALVVGLVALLAVLAVPALVRQIGYATTSARVLHARQSLESDDILDRISRATRAVADAVAPSVVHVEVRTNAGPWQFGSGSTGSGWVYDADGHVVTNAHVVRGADAIRVQFSDGRLFEATLIGADPFTDIAVLKVPTTAGLFPATRATGVRLQQGDHVYAFGSPFGFKFSMSQGIVSGIGREPRGAVASANGYTNFIQTDAAVNPGNSGGPLVDARGRVVGMNVAIATGTESEGTTEGQSAGISFAIPLATIESVVSQLIQNGSVSRGLLGITFSPRSGETLIERAGYNGYGVLVEGVSPQGPAERAGIRVGDVIVAIDGEPVTGDGVLRSLISNVRPGHSVRVRYWRAGEFLETTATLVENPRGNLVNASVIEALESAGLYVRDSFDARRGRIALDERPDVVGVRPGSAAELRGFASGQRISAVNGRPVRSIGELIVALDEAGFLLGRRTRFTVQDPADESNPSPEPRDVELRLGR